MKLNSVRNFRDIGGIPVNGYGIIREGLIYRSATVDNISSADKKVLEALKMKTIIDLRAPIELRMFRSRIDKIGRLILTLDFQNKTRQLIKPYIHKEGSEEILADISNKLYLDILDAARPVFRQIVELLLRDDSGPVLIHCQAGKDRTGIIIALLLVALGADRKSITEDFLKSNDELLPYFRKLLKIRKILSLGRFPAERMLYMVTVKERNINSILDRVEGHYKGIEGYLYSAGFEISGIEQLRRKFCTG